MTATTGSQDSEFARKLLDIVSRDMNEAIGNALEHDASWVIDWVADNFDPDQVFNSTTLATWANNNGYIKE